MKQFFEDFKAFALKGNLLQISFGEFRHFV